VLPKITGVRKMGQRTFKGNVGFFEIFGFTTKRIEKKNKRIAEYEILGCSRKKRIGGCRQKVTDKKVCSFSPVCLT